VEPEVRIGIRMSGFQCPMINSLIDNVTDTLQNWQTGRCPSHRVFRCRQVSQAIATLRLGKLPLNEERMGFTL